MTETPESDVVRRELNPDRGEPTIQVVEHLADIEGREPEELTSTYGCIDHVLDHVFSDPPAPEAAVEISFTYEGYRITVRQDGTARFVERG